MEQSKRLRDSGLDPQKLAELKEDFLYADADKDGRIDFAEFKGLLEELEAGMSTEELRTGFREIDTDHDGRIDLREFVVWWSEE